MSLALIGPSIIQKNTQNAGLLRDACRAYPDAQAIRCFAFEPSDMLIAANKPDMPNLVLFPPVRAGMQPSKPTVISSLKM